MEVPVGAAKNVQPLAASLPEAFEVLGLCGPVGFMGDVDEDSDEVATYAVYAEWLSHRAVYAPNVPSRPSCLEELGFSTHLRSLMRGSRKKK